jgi:hypothetical protein
MLRLTQRQQKKLLLRRLYQKNVVFARVGPEADLIDDDLASHIQQKLDGRGPGQQLLDSLEFIADCRGVEYWIERSGNWRKEKIEEIGIALPKDAVLPANLTEDQQKEIFDQEEAERIAGLSVGERAEEKSIKLHALAREAIMKAEEAELLGEIFDKKAWLFSKRAQIDLVYA